MFSGISLPESDEHNNVITFRLHEDEDEDEEEVSPGHDAVGIASMIDRHCGRHSLEEEEEDSFGSKEQTYLRNYLEHMHSFVQKEKILPTHSEAKTEEVLNISLKEEFYPKADVEDDS